MTEQEEREGEVRLGFDPAKAAGDASLLFIGKIRTPWARREDCPRNGLQTSEPCRIVLDAPYRPGLHSVSMLSHLIVLYWMHQSRRDLIVQAPRRGGGGAPRGTFAIRSPVRPNPISLSVVELLECDEAAGVLTVRGLDCVDGTPLLDIKPYFASTDSRPDAVVGWNRPA